MGELRRVAHDRELEGSCDEPAGLEKDLARALDSLKVLRARGRVLGSWTYGPLPTDYEGWSLPTSTELFDKALQPMADDLAALVQHRRELQIALCVAWHAFESVGLPEDHFEFLVEANREWYALSTRLAEAEVRFIETVARKGFRGYHAVDR
jgi:hypothetical protein